MRTPRELFFGDLRERWVEYVLAASMIAVVTGPLVLQRSVTASAEEKVHDLAHRLGKNMIVMPRASEPADFHMLRYDDGAMPQDYPERIRQSPLSQHVKVVHTRLNGNVEVDGVPLILVGEQGRGSAGTEMTMAPEAELGPEAAERLRVQAGDEITIRGVPVRVLGVRSPPPEGLGMGVFTSLATAQEILKRPGEINSMRLGGCWCRLDVPALAADIEKLLPGTRGITVAGVLEAQKGTVATMKRYSLALYIVGLLLADEPTGNLDPEMTDTVMDLFLELNAEGQTIVVVSHDRALAERGQRVVHLRDGRIDDDRPARSRSTVS